MDITNTFFWYASRSVCKTVCQLLGCSSSRRYWHVSMWDLQMFSDRCSVLETHKWSQTAGADTHSWVCEMLIRHIEVVYYCHIFSKTKPLRLILVKKSCASIWLVCVNEALLTNDMLNGPWRWVHRPLLFQTPQLSIMPIMTASRIIM